MCVFKNHAFIYFLRPPSWSGTVRTSVPQDWMTATLCTEELFLSTQYIALHKSERPNVGGRIQTFNTVHSAVPAGFHTSQLNLNMVYRVLNKSEVFLSIILRLGKIIKLFFSIPGNTVSRQSILYQQTVFIVFSRWIKNLSFFIFILPVFWKVM